MSGSASSTDDNEGMARSSSFRNLVSDLGKSLKTFQASGTSFSVLHRINARPRDSSRPQPTRLLILDSSFNPPSKAHFHLARDALSSVRAPRHLLLLFSVHNADKASSAASFPLRLAMMVLLGQEILSSLDSCGPSVRDASGASSGCAEQDTLQIDVAVTTKPYYTDKSLAITSSGTYAAQGSQIPHTHVLGYDTLIRFLDPKYYRDEYDPPLSAVAPYFDAGHSLRVALRPGGGFASVAEQKGFVEGIGCGALEAEGGSRGWGRLVQTFEVSEGAGISSTRIRDAAREERWEVVEGLCPKRVAMAVKEERIYADD